MATGGIGAAVCTLTNLNVRGSGLTVTMVSAGGAEGCGAEGKGT